MNIPEELLYSSDHEWVKVKGNTVVVGITDFAQDQLGDVVFVEVPEVDNEVETGGNLSTIESVKAVSDVYSPVCGKVVETNETLTDEPQLINEDPYGNGWIAKLELRDASELEGLMDAAAYAKLIAEEA
ncbi:MAG TPA: glycine cleavage system protein GcvH [Candidatus Avacidaminococcus intestinavium]|uniref:Glycine cleavage system H protein n=1 Tax=Candidatus Avacidaminococcus intestinavium TaxID=2840684 RepID=A0A9D1MRG9_9FIRM|nr:glycine cleavage system protein GcvH [Candidatus Avacidaminococcus intestinavium]